MMIPGRTLHRLAARICSAHTLEYVIEPAIADLQKEYAAADKGALVLSLIRGYVAILTVMAICALCGPFRRRQPRDDVAFTLVWSLVLISGVTLLLLLPPLLIVERETITSVSLVTLIPQAVPLAIPIGLTLGIAVGLANRSFTRATARRVLFTAALAALVSCATMVWVMPASNQAYRELVARERGISGPLAKGHSEMSLSELRRATAVATAAGNVRQAGESAWFFHIRFSLAAAAVAVSGFLLTVSVTGTLARVMVTLVVCLIYWGLLYTGEWLAVTRALVPAFAGAWLPNVVLIASAIITASRSSRFRVHGPA